MSLSWPGSRPGRFTTGDDATDHDRELGQASLGELVAGKRLVGRSKVDGAGLDLRDAAARSRSTDS